VDTGVVACRSLVVIHPDTWEDHGRQTWQVEPGAEPLVRAYVEFRDRWAPPTMLWISDLAAGRDTLVFAEGIDGSGHEGVGTCRVPIDSPLTDLRLICAGAAHDSSASAAAPAASVGLSAGRGEPRWRLDGDLALMGRDSRGRWAHLIHPIGSLVVRVPELAASFPPRAASGPPLVFGDEEFDPVMPRGVLCAGRHGLVLLQDVDGRSRGWLFIDRVRGVGRHRILASRRLSGRLAISGPEVKGWTQAVHFVQVSAELVGAALQVIEPLLVSSRLRSL